MITDLGGRSGTPLIDSLIVDCATRSDGLASIAWDDAWKHEHELWLEFLKQQGQLDRYYRRICKSNQAKALEAINEVKAAYFLNNLCRCRICEWEPSGQGNAIGEFSLQFGASKVFCEVKSPGWEREVVSNEGLYALRLKQPKHIPGEAGSYENTEDLREALTRAYRQFPDGQCCLLIITSDLQVSPLTDFLVEDAPLSVHRAFFDRFNGKEGCFTNGFFERCSGLLVLDVKYLCEGMTYRYHFSTNPYAAYSLPEQVNSRVGRFKGKWTRPDTRW